MSRCLACAMLGLMLCGASCSDSEPPPDAGGAVDDAGACAPCGVTCDGSCHPAGTPAGYCQACPRAGAMWPE